jgi:hypothetical protein
MGPPISSTTMLEFTRVEDTLSSVPSNWDSGSCEPSSNTGGSEVRDGEGVGEYVRLMALESLGGCG